MKRCVASVSAIALMLWVGPALAQQKAKAQNVAEIPYTSVPNFLKLPPGEYLGESVGVATNSKGHIFVYSRTGASHATVGTSRTFYKAGEIATRRSKTGEPVFWPAPRALRDILEAGPKHSAVTLCANSTGRPWTDDGFRASWRKIRIDLEQQGLVGPSLTLYGLRHTVAVILRESGADERTIADALGQKTIEMARHYARGADLRRKMRGVVASFDREVNRRRTKAVKPK